MRLALVIACVALSSVARADEPRGASPRASVRELQALCTDGRYDEVVSYLETSRRVAGSNTMLARRTCEVLAHVGVEPDQLSADSAGDTDDGLAPDREQIGTFTRPGGTADPIILEHDKVAPFWRLSRATVALVDAWYAALPARWLVGHLPQTLLRPAFFGLQRWQLFGIPLALFAMVTSGLLLAVLTRKTIERLRGAEKGQSRLTRPFGFLWAGLVGRALVPSLGLPLDSSRTTEHALNLLISLSTFWSAAALIEGLRGRLSRAPWAQSNAGSRALLQLASRSVKLVLFLCAAVATLAQIGVPVTSLLAAFGVGGLGLALAAQKTVENLFGAFAIGVDQPFREGDYITVEGGVSGTVERIGLRSTRLRTVERTVIAIPNGKLADSKTENFTARDRFRLSTTLGLSYGTTAEQVQKIVDRTTGLLKKHPKVYTDVVVQLTALGSSGINIDVNCTFRAADLAEFMAIRQDVLLDVIAVVEQAGASLAVPPQRLELVGELGRAPKKPA